MSDTWLPDWRYYGICSRWQVEVLFMIDWQCLFCCSFFFYTFGHCVQKCPAITFIISVNITIILTKTIIPPIRPPTIQFSASIPILPAIPKFLAQETYTFFWYHRDILPKSNKGNNQTLLLYCKPPSFIKFLFSSHIRSCTGCWCFRAVLTRKDTLNAYSVLVSLWAGCFVFKVRVRSKKRFLH